MIVGSVRSQIASAREISELHRFAFVSHRRELQTVDRSGAGVWRI